MSLRSSFDVQHPIFRPLWRRVAVVGILSAWTLYELSSGNWVWATVFGAAVAYLAFEFFVAFDPKNYETPDDGD